MDEYEIDYLMALAEVMCDVDTSPKINGYRWEGVKRLFTIVRAYQTAHVHNELLKTVWEKKLAKVTSATTKGEIEARVYYYVSVEKAWSEAGARSNFRVYNGEFINLTFLNSEWLRYAILNKKIGRFNIAGQSVDYAYAVHYLKVMLDHLQHRELEEKKLIAAHIPSLEDACPTWMVHLSEWKVQMCAQDNRIPGQTLCSLSVREKHHQ